MSDTILQARDTRSERKQQISILCLKKASNTNTNVQGHSSAYNKETSTFSFLDSICLVEMATETIHN